VEERELKREGGAVFFNQRTQKRKEQGNGKLEKGHKK
jgi:hypothetical protein